MIERGYFLRLLATAAAMVGAGFCVMYGVAALFTLFS